MAVTTAVEVMTLSTLEEVTVRYILILFYFIFLIFFVFCAVFIERMTDNFQAVVTTLVTVVDTKR